VIFDRPTFAQVRALQDIRDHGDPTARVHGRSAHGGLQGTLAVIVRKRWAYRQSHDDAWVLTDAGVTLLREVEEKLARAFT
jgi:hypothetical protein